MTVLRVCYKSGVRFDEAYYKAKHLPLSAGIMAPFGLKSAEVMKVAPNPDGSKPPYQVIFSAYFASAADLQNAMQSPKLAEVIDDIKSFYDGMPEIMVGETVAIPA
jgi:uncharacterized protein (TIGR02118 family)